MAAVVALVLAGATLRVAGALIYGGRRRLPARILAGATCATAAWVGASAGGAWSPWWPALAGGTLAALLEPAVGRWGFRLTADLLVGLIAALTSIAPLSLWATIGVISGVTVLGAIADGVVGRWVGRRPWSLALLVAGLIALSASLVIWESSSAGGPGERWRALARRLPHLGLSGIPGGTRVPLSTGAVAWLDRPVGRGPFPGALVFHGAHHDGSRQAAATALRRALVEAGFVVMAVDHPGFGSSPAPRLTAMTEAWDPLPTARAALSRLRETTGDPRVVVLGHSMGVSDVLRLLAIERDIAAAVLLGASVREGRTDYWYKRFHQDRRLAGVVPVGRYLDIDRAYYDNVRLVKSLPPTHSPIVFVRFGLEHADVVATRDGIYEALPGAKVSWELPTSSHYLSARVVAGHVLIGDTSVARGLTSRLRRLRSEAGLAP